jgi:hypothetical protein
MDEVGTRASSNVKGSRGIVSESESVSVDLVTVLASAPVLIAAARQSAACAVINRMLNMAPWMLAKTLSLSGPGN